MQLFPFLHLKGQGWDGNVCRATHMERKWGMFMLILSLIKEGIVLAVVSKYLSELQRRTISRN